MREFRSELPSLIHRRGIDIEPVTLEVSIFENLYIYIYIYIYTNFDKNFQTMQKNGTFAK